VGFTKPIGWCPRIVERHNPGKPAHCVELYSYLLSNIAKPHTLQSAYGYLKQKKHATSRDAVRSYLQWAVDSWLLFVVPIHANSHKEEERNYKKIYSIDWSLAVHNSAVWDGSYSRALENMVYLHLIRHYSRVRYYLTRTKRQEVDFVVSGNDGRPEMLVQVCQDIGHGDTLRRELEPLVAAAQYFGTRNNFIVTMSQETQIKESGIAVQVIPAWKWLLDPARSFPEDAVRE
jgi:predicted AAA+ superfamily ATPase